MRTCFTLFVATLFLFFPDRATAQADHWPDYRQINEHLASPPPFVRTEWREDAPTLLEQSYGGDWDVLITVDEAGAVSHAEVRSGAAGHRDEVIAAAREMRFRPFELDGRAVSRTFSYSIASRPADYVGPDDRTFPEYPDLSGVRIRTSAHRLPATLPPLRCRDQGRRRGELS